MASKSADRKREQRRGGDDEKGQRAREAIAEVVRIFSVDRRTKQEKAQDKRAKAERVKAQATVRQMKKYDEDRERERKLEGIRKLMVR